MPRQRSYRDSLDAILGYSPPEEEATGGPEDFARESADARLQARRLRSDAGLLQSASDFASAASMGALKPRDVAGPMRERATQVEQEPLRSLTERGKARELMMSEAEASPDSDESQRARALFRGVAKGVVDRMGEESFNRMTARQIRQALPDIDSYLGIEAKRDEADRRRVAETERAQTLREHIVKRYPGTASLPLEKYDARALERLWLDEEQRDRAAKSAGVRVSEGTKNRQTTLTAASIREGADESKAARVRAEGFEELAGPAGALPKESRKPQDSDRRAFGSTWKILTALQADVKRLKSMVDEHGPATILQDPNLRGTAESIGKRIQVSSKGPEMLALGVLAGPDLGLIQGMFPETTSVSAALADLLGQSSVAARLEESLGATGRLYEASKEQYGYTMPGDPDYDASKARFERETGPIKARGEKVWVQRYNENGTPDGAAVAMSPEDARRFLSRPNYRRSAAPH